MNTIKQTFKNMRLSGILFCTLVFTLIAGCASSNKPPANSTPVTQIMVLPVAPVKKLFTENKGVPIGVLWQGIADRSKSTTFTESMEATRKSLGSDTVLKVKS